MNANDIQHGGDHYKTGYEHWDWAIDMNMGPLEYAATKYVSRWWKKEGELDLRKPAHYVQKIMEARGNARPYMSARDRMWINGPTGISEAYAVTRKFGTENNLTEAETLVCWLLASWTSLHELRAAHRILEDLAADPQRAAGGRAGPGAGSTGPAQGAAAGAAVRAAGGQPGGPAGSSAPHGSAASPLRARDLATIRKGGDGMEHPFGYRGEDAGRSCPSCGQFVPNGYSCDCHNG